MNEQEKRELIKSIAIDWVCPLNHNPTTPYEIGEVGKLVRFAEKVIKNIGDSELSK